MTQEHPAAKYNRIRRIVLSTYHDSAKGPAVARQWLDTTYRRELGPQGYAGLRAEMEFYDKHRLDYQLTPAADVGDHVDFSGIFDGKACRFDVTTDISFKKWEDYEPFLVNGFRYKIAVYSHNTFELSEVLDLGFRRCAHCGDGSLIPCLALLPANLNSDGESNWSHDQLELTVCTYCHAVNEGYRHTHPWVFTTQELLEDVSRMDEDDLGLVAAARTAAEDHPAQMYRYFRKNIADLGLLMSVAESAYDIDDPSSGDGHHVLRFVYTNPAVASAMPDEVEYSLDE